MCNHVYHKPCSDTIVFLRGYMFNAVCINSRVKIVNFTWNISVALTNSYTWCVIWIHGYTWIHGGDKYSIGSSRKTVSLLIGLFYPSNMSFQNPPHARVASCFQNLWCRTKTTRRKTNVVKEDNRVNSYLYSLIPIFL